MSTLNHLNEVIKIKVNSIKIKKYMKQNLIDHYGEKASITIIQQSSFNSNTLTSNLRNLKQEAHEKVNTVENMDYLIELIAKYICIESKCIETFKDEYPNT